MNTIEKNIESVRLWMNENPEWIPKSINSINDFRKKHFIKATGWMLDLNRYGEISDENLTALFLIMRDWETSSIHEKYAVYSVAWNIMDARGGWD